MTKSEIKIQIKQINSALDALLQDDRRIKSAQYDAWITDLLLDMNEVGLENWGWRKLVDSATNRKDLKRQKVALECILNPNTDLGSITSTHLQQAKDISIGSLLEFNRAGFAKCLWHNDNNPSMKWFKKNNKVKCFSCGQIGDSVDVTMKLYNLNLPQAVKKLLNM